MPKKGKQFKGWTQRVKEAQRDPIVFELDDDVTITINQPTGRTVREMQDAGDDLDAVITAFCGQEDGKKLLEAYDDAPFNVLPELLEDLMQEFGLSMGNLQAPRS